ncbi:MAG: DUF5050 domain-containing protein [Clostridiales bacterium]|nr:DUF5050 domain-containing protein [Clostridiales bacterium]
MKSTKKNIIILILTFTILISLLTVYTFFRGRIPENEPGTVGNTAGNLNNRGLYCEDDGKVYFANAYDNYSLYSMNPDETELKKLSNSQVEDINAGGHYLYYFQTDSASSSDFSFISRFNGIYRTKKNGNNTVCLTKDTAVLTLLVDDYLYYQHYDSEEGISLHKLKTDKSKEIVVTDDNVNPASIENGIIYFNGTGNDHYLYTLNTYDDSIQTLWDGNLLNPVAYGDYIYYMDVPNNYRLCRYSLSDGSTQVVTEDRIDCFNIAGSYIYYQKNDVENPALKRVTLDGQNEEIIREGNHDKINATSNYVYFSEFNLPVPVYKTPVNGPVNVTTFDAALTAAEKNLKK